MRHLAVLLASLLATTVLAFDLGKLTNRRQFPTAITLRSLHDDNKDGSMSCGRRDLLLTTLVAGGATVSCPANAVIGRESDWPLWPALPVAPYARRKTVRQQVAPKVWIFDQLIGIYYVHVPIRMTVIALDSGGMFVYAPVAPTTECLSLLQPLIDEYGPIKTIILPSVAVEHKVLAGPFARRFPDADLFVVSKQYAFPLNLPDRTLGLPSWTKRLPMSSHGMWGSEMEHEVLDVKPGPGSEYQDAAFFHRPSQTLLVCDAIIAVNDEPPAILTADPEYTRALLFHARDDPLELVPDTPENRRKGWRRIVLLFNFFFPGAAVGDLGLGPLLKLRPYDLGWAGWKPFEWKDEASERRSFDAYKAGGRPTVFPIVQIILSRGDSGRETKAWLEKVTQWKFVRVIPQHLDAPLKAGPRELREAFAFLYSGRNEVRFCDEDVAFLRLAEDSFLGFSVFPSRLGTLRGRICGL